MGSEQAQMRTLNAEGLDPTVEAARLAANLRVRVDSGEPLDVRSFVIEERMSSLFTIRLGVVSASTDLDFDAIVGHEASFSMTRPRRHDASRTWTGICCDLQQLTAEDRGLSTYELTLVPSMWLLTQRRNHRMFQHRSELAIALAILGEWGITPEVAVVDAPRPREYRVQYGETDFAFLSRMLEEAGISFFFRVGDEGATLVLSDAPHAAEARSPAIAYRDRPTQADQDHVTKVRLGQQVRPGRYTVRDHDARLPANYPLAATAAVPGDGVEGRLEAHDYAPGAFLFGGATEGGTPCADDRGTSRSDEKEGARLASRRLEGERASRRRVDFRTTASDLGPGVVMTIVDHPRSELDGTERLLVVASRHEGLASEDWVHTCEATRASAPYRPRLETPRPKVAGVECATVVGPSGDEIHTDEFGRVRVHVHWDRESQMDEKSSCWIPVSHAWGGAGYGGTNLPRIGQEVIVDFLSGDPDRPVVVGRVYTNQQKTPYKLPENRTQSGWKSCSTQQTGGYNEIMFEDAAGKELVRMQAEKDLDKLVKNDETVVIGRDRTKQVKHDDALTVNHDRIKKVDNDEAVTIGNDRTEEVLRDETVLIGRDRTKRVESEDDLSVGGNRTKTVEQNEREVVAISRTRTVGVNEAVTVGVNQTVNVGMAQQVSVGASQSVSVGGAQTVNVGMMATETVGLAKMLTVGAAYQISVGAVMNTTVALMQSEQVGLTKSVDVGQSLTVTAGETITLTCGESSVTLAKDGTITLKGKMVAVTGTDGVDVLGKVINLN
jgi:type VI secretion system secreted protein VgrG